MVYRTIGVMSGSSLDGLDVAFVELQEAGGRWKFEILQAETHAYSPEWFVRLGAATGLSCGEYLELDAAFGRYIGEAVTDFIQKHGLEYKVHLVSSHGHTTFHRPGLGLTAQLGHGAGIAAVTGLPVVSDLRALDVALGGQGAPIVPIGERLLFPEYAYFLNLGGIANLSVMREGGPVAFDVCPANRVLNLLAAEKGQDFDRDGGGAAAGSILGHLLKELDRLPYYEQPFPKSLPNEFGTGEVLPLVRAAGGSVDDQLRTYTEHIARQIKNALAAVEGPGGRMMVTGGGAHNLFLTSAIGRTLEGAGVEIQVPDADLVNFKEALVMALIGVLRLRQEENTLSGVTGASRNSIGGALWIG